MSAKTFSRKNFLKLLRDIFCLVAGSGLMAVAVAWVYDPIGMVTGGFTGIAITVKHVTEPWIPGGMPMGITTFLLNIPIFIWTFKSKDRGFLVRTIFATTCLSLWLAVLPPAELVNGDYLLSAILGGILTGLGIGLVLLGKGTTGGTDLLAVLLHSLAPHLGVVEILMVVDAAVVLVGVGVFGLYQALYAMIAIFLVTKVSDRITEGLKFAKGAFIITGEKERVADEIMTTMDRGVTALSATGMYSNASQGMLYCVVSKKEIVRLKEIVYEIDPGAFISVTDVREVLGEGFHPYIKDY